jgi:transmembrane sensor
MPVFPFVRTLMAELSSADTGGRPVDPEIARQASAWFAMFLNGADTAADRVVWREWRAADPEHERAWQHVEAVNLSLSKAPEQRSYNPWVGLQRARQRRVFSIALVVLVCGAGVLAVKQPQVRDWVGSLMEAAR